MTSKRKPARSTTRKKLTVGKKTLRDMSSRSAEVRGGRIPLLVTDSCIIRVTCKGV